MRIAIVGGGIVGLAAAHKLLENGVGKVVLLEKEDQVGRHQSTHNSGVLHAGLYYKAGSAKARMAVSGIRQMVAFAREHEISHEICGKLVVATDPSEVERLRGLHGRGIENGLSGLRWINGRSEISTIEPNCGGIAALHVPEEGIIDYGAVCTALADGIRGRGGEVRTGWKVTSARRQGREWVLSNARAELSVDYLVNCGGLYSDRVALLAGEPAPVKIVPFRGEYFRLGARAEGLVRNLIYPVPDPTFPFLGVHFTRMIHGGVEAGPNAVLALSREGYQKTDVRPGDVFDALTYPGLWRFLARHRVMCWQEVRRSMSRARFAHSLQKLVPDIRESDLEAGGSGVRAQAMSPSGELVQDFSLIRGENALHVLNAPSPAATASLAIADEIVSMVAAR